MEVMSMDLPLSIIPLLLRPVLVSFVAVLAFIAVLLFCRACKITDDSKVKEVFKSMSIGVVGALVVVMVLNFQEVQWVGLQSLFIGCLIFVVIVLCYIGVMLYLILHI
jgi:hypothetical protein